MDYLHQAQFAVHAPITVKTQTEFFMSCCVKVDKEYNGMLDWADADLVGLNRLPSLVGSGSNCVNYGL